MERWITLSRQDPKFQDYLQGTFSKDYRAIPVRSLNVNTKREQVTFEVVPLKEITKPPAPIVWARSLRPVTLIFSVGPMVATLLYLLQQNITINKLMAVSSFLGVLFFHVSMNLLNDYYDHLKGQDRIRSRGGSRSIQNGWVTAKGMHRLSLVALALAVICGLPAIISHFSLVIALLVLTLLAGLEFSSDRLGLKYRGLGELLAFLLTGPFLTVGYSWAISGRVHSSTIVLGAAFGMVTALYYYLAHFEDIMVDSQASVLTLSSWLGFEASKKGFFVLAALSLLSVLLFVGMGDVGVVSWLAVATHLGVVIPMGLQITRAPSCLSSGLTGVRRAALILHFLMALALSFAFLQ